MTVSNHPAPMTTNRPTRKSGRTKKLLAALCIGVLLVGCSKPLEVSLDSRVQDQIALQCNRDSINVLCTVTNKTDGKLSLTRLRAVCFKGSTQVGDRMLYDSVDARGSTQFRTICDDSGFTRVEFRLQ